MLSAYRISDGAQSVHRAVALLRLLSARSTTGWRLSDLAVEAELECSTVHRLLGRLLIERFVMRVPGTKRYTLGPLAYELGVATMPHFAIERLAAPALERVAGETRDIVFLNIRSGNESVCVARHDGRQALKAYTVEVGTRRPLILSAGGVAMLIALPQTEQIQIEVQNLHAIERRGEARQSAVRTMLQRSRNLGYGCNQEDIIPGIVAIGVPICSESGEPIASLSLASSSADLKAPRRRRLIERLTVEAEGIAKLLGQLRL